MESSDSFPTPSDEVLAELNERYFARVAELVQAQPGRLDRPHWFRTSFSNWDGSGIYHGDRDCAAIRQVVDHESQAGATIYELDVATGEAWKWEYRGSVWRRHGHDVPVGWFRPGEDPMYTPDSDLDDVAEWLAAGFDPIEIRRVEADRHLHFDMDNWRACQRCGGSAVPTAKVCTQCWLTPCECEER